MKMTSAVSALSAAILLCSAQVSAAEAVAEPNPSETESPVVAPASGGSAEVNEVPSSVADAAELDLAVPSLDEFQARGVDLALGLESSPEPVPASSPHLEQITSAQRARLQELLQPLPDPAPPVTAVVLNDASPYVIDLSRPLTVGRYAVDTRQAEVLTTDGRFALVETTTGWQAGTIIVLRPLP